MDRPPGATSIPILIRLQAEQRPEAEALLSPGRTPLTYRRLWDQVQTTAASLHGFGLVPGSRIAIALPDSSDSVLAQLAVASFGVSCPLNPEYRRGEFAAFFADLGAAAVILPSGAAGEGHAAAQSMGLPILELASEPGSEAGVFSLSGSSAAQVDAWREPNDVAYMLFTSGSTAKPKVVPIRHRNLMTSASAISNCYQLVLGDRCLNLVPEFHSFGLLSGLLASMWAGTTVICVPGLQAERFVPLVQEMQPTWYTAVPTTHRVVLDQVRSLLAVFHPNTLRFGVSRGAPLPPGLMQDLERVLEIPILQGYGATETCTLGTCNPLPPEVRKLGSAGRRLAQEVEVVDGEVMIRGGNVVDGYLEPSQSREAFHDGWFQTGDLGYFDSDGYLFITGRKKQVINRGGEKISPFEVEDVLLLHPAVEDAACFPVPHPRLGEEMAAAVILKSGASPVSELDLIRFVAERKASFLVPARIHFTGDLPLNAIGKLDRNTLAQRYLALPIEEPSGPVKVMPRTPLEKQLAVLWEKTLRISPIGVRDDFFDIGGSSLMAAQLFAEISRVIGNQLPLAALLTTSTIEKLAVVLEKSRPTPPTNRGLVALQAEGSRPPFYCVHGMMGKSLRFRELSIALGPDQPFYAFEAADIDRSDISSLSIEKMAENYLEEVRAIQARGPYYLGGMSTGGMVAFEMSRLLHAQGEQVALLALFDPRLPANIKLFGDKKLVLRRAQHFLKRLGESGPQGGWQYVRGIARDLNHFRAYRKKNLAPEAPEIIGNDPNAIPPENILVIKAAHLRAANRYVPVPFPGRGVLFLAQTASGWTKALSQSAWTALLQGGVEVLPVAGRTLTYFSGENLPEFAEQVKQTLAGAVKRTTESRGPTQ